MEQQITPEYIKQLVYTFLPEVLAQYKEERDKDIYLNPLLERLIRLEDELKALRIEMNIRFETVIKEMNIRFEAIIKEMNLRFEAQKQESDARFEAINTRFEAINTRFEAINTRFEAINTRFEALIKEMNTRFEALDKRLNFLQWLIGIGITLLGGLITLLNFFR
jgi:chromosome segregation ATPase